MKTKIIITFFTFFIASFTCAQNKDYYYYKGKKIPLSIDENFSTLNKKYYKRSSGAPSIQISDIFYIKLKKEDDYSCLVEMTKDKKVSIIHKNKFMPLWYRLKLKKGNTKTSLELSNEFYETGCFANVDPAFMFDFSGSCTNDTSFEDLWGLNNSENPNVDINACNAWDITEGNGINVAVLDQGIDTTHNDLNDNISDISYDTQNGSSPSVFTNGRNHGTHVAGIIGAEKDNELQVVGVAPQSRIISISHTLSVTPSISEELADGINWAVQNGAHVINNSWGDQGGSLFDDLHSSILEDAIENAMSNGRNGLGTIMVFASGNRSPAIDYPANFHDEIIVVGAITSNGNKSSFSGFGADLDVVAPGSGILSTISNQRITSLDGTSMAAPHVSGVAALVLSVNPNLTGEQVRDIIESTAQKVGDYSYTNNSNRPNGIWNNEMGYGLVDAHAAVQEAVASLTPILTGPSTVCPTDTSFTLSGVPTGQTVTWSVSSNLQLVSSNATGATVRAVSSSTSGNATLTATLSNGTEVQQTVWIGVPQIKVALEPIEANLVAVHMVGTNGSNINYQGITSTVWQKISSNGGCYASFGGSDFEGLGRGNCTNWSVYVKISATNSCGTTTLYRTITPPIPAPCDEPYRIERTTGHHTYSVIDPCRSSRAYSFSNKLNSRNIENQEIWVYDHYGNVVFSTNETEFDLSFLSKGIYFIKASINGEAITQKIAIH